LRVLVLSRSTGEGHNHVALALGEAFRARGHECEVTDAASIAVRSRGESSEPSTASRVLSHGADTASRLYCWAALKQPWMFGAVTGLGRAWERTPLPSPIRHTNLTYVEPTRAYIDGHGFDAVLSTHTFPQEALSVIRSKYPSHVRYYSVLTDFSCTPFFAESKVDGYFIAHDEIRADCERRGMPRERTYALGMPVAAAFREPHDKETARGELGLARDVPVFLLMAGGVGSTSTSVLCDRLLTLAGERVRVVVLSGRREDMYLRVADRFRNDHRVAVVPFTDRVPTYMAAADVLVSKPGAVSSVEAAVLGVPLVHTAAIPGIEANNARFFAERGMSVFEPKPDRAAAAACALLRDTDARAAMLAAQAANLIPDGADRVVAKVEALAA
jgi:processive 1,2-diacylglycerol beta-glucosyltransferase